MAEVRLMTAFGTVPADVQEGIRQVLQQAIETIDQEERTFRTVKAVFTESNEQCVFTAEVDGVRKEPNPLVLDLEQLEDAVTDSGARSLLTEAIRGYLRRSQGR